MPKDYPMTPGSGITIHPDGRLAIGCEAKFTSASPAGDANRAFLSVPIPEGATVLEIHSGDAKLTPWHSNVVEGLFRVHLLPNGLVTDDLSAPIVSVVLGANNNQPSNAPIEPCAIPVGPSDKFIAVELQEASGTSPHDLELQITGLFRP